LMALGNYSNSGAQFTNSNARLMNIAVS
jgi:hypothetical protein